jgi:pre-rRNA-processing protein IPI3
MHLQEVILSATAPAVGAGAGTGTVYLHDIQTGTSLATFKQTSANPHCTAFVESDGQQGGLIFSSQPDKTIMNIYSFQKACLDLCSLFSVFHSAAFRTN